MKRVTPKIPTSVLHVSTTAAVTVTVAVAEVAVAAVVADLPVSKPQSPLARSAVMLPICPFSAELINKFGG